MPWEPTWLKAQHRQTAAQNGHESNEIASATCETAPTASAPPPWEAALASLGWPPAIIADIRTIRAHHGDGYLTSNCRRITEALRWGPTGFDAAYVVAMLRSLAEQCADPCAAAYLTSQPDGIPQVVYVDDRYLAAWLRQRHERELSEKDMKDKAETRKRQLQGIT